MKIAILIWCLVGVIIYVREVLSLGTLKVKDILLFPFVIALMPLLIISMLSENMDTVIWRRK